jgi:hypothetical protein
MWSLPFFDALAGARSVLIAGAGGGFDVYAGLPLALALQDNGTTVHFASSSSSQWSDSMLTGDLGAITPATRGPADFFPERTLARWLDRQGMEAVVYAFRRSLGVKPLRTAYRLLVRKLSIDAIVLVDGGTDILMRGDESGLGTPAEDIASVAAVARLTVPVKLVAALGFGIDSYHGISHVHVLENLAAITRSGAFLGAFSIPGSSRVADLYQDAVAHARRESPEHASIVQGQIAAALAGWCGNVQFTGRTGNTRLFVNPLMAMYFTAELAGLARHVHYLDLIEQTAHSRQISTIIADYREKIELRPARSFPH